MKLKEIKQKLDAEYKAYETIFKRGVLDIESSTYGLDNNIRYFVSKTTPIHKFIQICDKIRYSKLDNNIETKISCLEQEEKGILQHMYFENYMNLTFVVSELYCGVQGDLFKISVDSFFSFGIGYNNWVDKKKILLNNSLRQSEKIKEEISKIITYMDNFCREYSTFKDKYL